MCETVYFANILLSKDHPMGRSRGPKRNNAGWYHSISVFAYTSISDLPVGGKPVYCKVIHFYGESGGPVLKEFDTDIQCVKKHMGENIYIVSGWDDSIGVIGDIRTLSGYQPGYGQCKTPIENIVNASIKKWGDQKIPYAHQRNESYNCVGFVDDILVWSAKGYWNNRIEAMHNKHGLYI